IHSGGLAELVARRSARKQVTAFLFQEPGPERATRERSMAVSKRFGYYRKRMKIDGLLAGKNLRAPRRPVASPLSSEGCWRCLVSLFTSFAQRPVNGVSCLRILRGDVQWLRAKSG